MIEIKLKKLPHNVYVPVEKEKHEPLFEHVAGDKYGSKRHLKDLKMVFWLHGIKLVFPVTCEDTGTLWRVKDGVEFRKNENSKYYMVESMMHRPYEYDFEVLSDGYNFTSEKGEINK